jgi:hypothetical protein
MTARLVFPTRLFGPSLLIPDITGQSISGGVSLSGEQQRADASGGGRVVATFDSVDLLTREKVLAWRRFARGARAGATAVLVPFADRRHQPVNPKYTGVDTFGLDTWVADDTSWSASEVTATVSTNAAREATVLSFALTAPLRLLGGEWFSILHATYGWRIYSAERVRSGGTVGSAVATTVTVSPPLREAVSAGAALNFESPRGLMQAAGNLGETLSLLRFGKAKVDFVEWPGPAPT